MNDLSTELCNYWVMYIRAKSLLTYWHLWFPHGVNSGSTNQLPQPPPPPLSPFSLLWGWAWFPLARKRNEYKGKPNYWVMYIRAQSLLAYGHLRLLHGVNLGSTDQLPPPTLSLGWAWLPLARKRNEYKGKPTFITPIKSRFR